MRNNVNRREVRILLVFEHFGLWGEEAYDYLKELAKGS